MAEKIPVSVLVMTKNEEMNLEGCLRSVQRAGEIVIVDSHSSDGTLDIAEKYTGRIYQYDWDGRWPKKSWSLETPQFSNDWILMIDADERATDEFMDELSGVAARPDNGTAGYLVRYDYRFLGRVLKYGDPVRKLVLFRKSRARFERYDIKGTSESPFLEMGHEHPILDGKIGRMKARLLHEDMRPLYYYFERHNRYSTWEACKRAGAAKTRHIEGNIAGDTVEIRRFCKNCFLRLPFKPLLYFTYSYIFRLGFLDGYPGLCYNICKAVYSLQIGMKMYEIKLNGDKK
ncbi:MAG: glycosyltransferase family 2 protein [Candidatus Omnitrophota bacterium]